MIVQLAKTALVWLVVIVVVGFILYQFFTDPAGSAQFVGTVAHKIGDAFSAIITFIKTLAAQF